MPISRRNVASLFPFVRYSPQANTMTVAGDAGEDREISFLGKSFAIDIEHASSGWLLLGTGQRDWKPFPILDEPPPAPAPTYKIGYWLLVYAPKLLGRAEPFEICASTAAFGNFVVRLYNESEGHFGSGSVPIVKITEAKVVKTSKGNTRDLVFTIEKWIPRPDAFVAAMEKLKASTSSKPASSAAGQAGR